MDSLSTSKFRGQTVSLPFSSGKSPSNSSWWTLRLREFYSPRDLSSTFWGLDRLSGSLVNFLAIQEVGLGGTLRFSFVDPPNLEKSFQWRPPGKLIKS